MRPRIPAGVLLGLALAGPVAGGAVPLGLPPLAQTGTAPATRAQVELGRKLFMDRRLSHNGTLSCAMCHVPEQGFTSNELATAVGLEGQTVRRNSPTLYNVAFVRRLFHDGREFSLENQAWGPLLAANEMGNPSIGHVIERIRGLPDYAGMFRRAYRSGPDVVTIGRALAAYQRTLLSANSPFDRWRYGGRREAMEASARRGFALFVGRAGCAACHTLGPRHALLSDGRFHNTGIGYARSMGLRRTHDVPLAPGVSIEVDDSALAAFEAAPPDVGRYEVTLDPADSWAYRTPTLRNVALTGPYMHDGSLPTLEAVVDFYDRGGIDNPGRSPLVRPLGLSAAEKAELAAFLRSLTGDNAAALARGARRGLGPEAAAPAPAKDARSRPAGASAQ